RNWDRVRHDSLEPYVRRVIINAAISRARRRAILSIIPTHSPPERSAGGRDVDLRHVLMEALRALPPRQRAVVVLRYWEDLSETQTAEVLGCSVGTVKSQASKAMTKLRSALGRESAEGVIRNAHLRGGDPPDHGGRDREALRGARPGGPGHPLLPRQAQ